MPFSNPVMAGKQLVRNVMQSLNFVANVSGWQIARDGDAQFNDVTLTGTFNGTDYVINSSGAFFYSGTPAAGNLIASVASSSGTDAFGNSYAEGMTSYGSSGEANLNDGVLNLLPTGDAGAGGAGGTASGILEVFSPQVSGTDITASVALKSKAVAPAGTPEVDISGALCLEISNPAPASQSSLASAYATTDAALAVIDGGDGNAYDTERMTLLLTSDYSATSTLTNLPGLSFAAQSARTYRIRGRLFIANGSSAAATVKLNLSATGSFANSIAVASNTFLPVWSWINGPSVAFTGTYFSEGASLENFNWTSAAMAVASDGYLVDFDGIIEVTSACTVHMQLAEGVSGDTFTVKAGPASFMDVMPVTA
jgi:hypothetical protein